MSPPTARPLGPADIDDALDVARQAVLAAGAAAHAYVGRAVTVDVKTFAGDVVTAADRDAEAAASEVLTRRTPHFGQVGEEGAHRPGSPHWVLDALDGSLNFVRGDPYWCAAVALVDDDGPLVAAIHQPTTSRLLSAARGRGVRDGDHSLPAATHRPALSQAVVTAYLEQDDLDRQVHHLLLPYVAGLRVRGSGSLDMAAVATGVSDVWIGRNMQPWDRDPGALLITEAGGAITNLRLPGQDDDWFVAAADPLLLEQVISVISETGHHNT